MHHALRFTLMLAAMLALALPAPAQILETAEVVDYFGNVVATGDFNGDDEDDLAVGVPDEDLSGANNAGVVHILYGTAGGGLADTGNQVWSQDSPGIIDVAETSDRFGNALAAGDFDNDGFDDLAVGASGEGYPLTNGTTASLAGGVHVLYGSSSGLSSRNQRWNQSSPGITFAVETGDRFGYALTAGDFNADGRDDLVIGVPFEDIGAVQDAGFVHVLYGASGGLTGTGAQSYSQDTIGNGTAVETGDRFGNALAAGDFGGDGRDDLAIGSPYEDWNTFTDAGVFQVLNGTPTGLTLTNTQLWVQGVGGLVGNPTEAGATFGFSLAAGDFDGDNRDDLAIGSPFEDLGSGLTNAGVTTVLYGAGAGLTATGGQSWQQNVPGVQGSVEAGDEFGRSLTVGDFDGNGRDDLAIGVPGEGVTANGDTDQGAINVLYGSSAGLTADGDDYWHQDVGSLKEVAEAGDSFGWSIASGDFDGDGRDDLTVGVPYEDFDGLTNAGVAQTLYGASGGLTDVGNQLWYQGAAAPLTLVFAPINPPAPVVIARGETGSFSATFTTGPNVPESFEYWTEAVLPNGNVFGPLVGPNTLMLDPDATVSLIFSLRIPNSAPLGSYTHRMEAGTFPNDILVSDSYGATVVNSAAREGDLAGDPGGDEWLAYDAEGNLLEAGTVTDLRGLAQDESDAAATAEAPAAASEAGVPDAPVLHAAYPNPFSRQATVGFALPSSQRVRLAVYDVLGREVAVLLDGTVEAGTHEAVLEADTLPSGVYVVRLMTAGGIAQTQRLTLLR